MAKTRITSKQVREWALEHLKDPDGVTYNRYTRIASRLDYLEGELEKALSENDRLLLTLAERPTILAHRVRDAQAAVH
jgi:transcriptional regulator NrdR family protein